MSYSLRRLSTREPDFQRQLAQLLATDTAATEDVQQTVRKIIQAVRTRGDAALVEYTNRFDHRNIVAASELEQRDVAACRARVDSAVQAALEADLVPGDAVDDARTATAVRERQLVLQRWRWSVEGQGRCGPEDRLLTPRLVGGIEQLVLDADNSP